jgi:hypothetical protein
MRHRRIANALSLTAIGSIAFAVVGPFPTLASPAAI